MVCDNYGLRYVPDQERIPVVIRIPRLNKLYVVAIGGHRSLFDVDAVVTSVSWPPVILVAGNGWLDWLCAHVERSINLIGQLKGELLSRGWSIANEPSLAVLCVEPPRGCQDIREIVDSILASGLAWVSTATFEGWPVIRACVTHGETTPDDITLLVDMLETAARAPIKPI